MDSGLEILKLDSSRYRQFFAGGLSALADYYAETGEKPAVLAASWDGIPCGALFYLRRDNAVLLCYAEVRDTFRRRGVCRALLDQALDEWKADGVAAVKIEGLVVNTPRGAAADHILRERGFTAVREMRVVINHLTGENRRKLRAFLESRGNRLIAALEKKFVVKTFQDSPAEKWALLTAARSHPGLEGLNPFSLEGLREDISFIVCRDRGPIAYCAQREPVPGGDGVEVAAYTCVPNYRKTGAGPLALLKSLDAIEKSAYQRVVFRYDPQNQEMLRFQANALLSFGGKTTWEALSYELALPAPHCP